ncbi:DNA polymerase III subunit delta' [Nocardioides mesophilus]|uniref:DNA polymerase III subunit delta' n=1 Tax=Nocardioides mesophilus TaxID=433659 RepID=A0A7G9RGF3_9ACTN|nr:DNA polymerase III subunit delta' [Nocardioides mesophilus]QNN54678.1 DNA polymerase III subunit delta' [Nocardioides mesophilus]
MSATAPVTSVWSGLVGQRHVVETLSRAVAGQGMTHAWLFTGPPGSGRSNAAIAFAAALQCPRGGCGTCAACQTALAGTHPDVSVTRSETAVLYIDDMRELVHRSALAPVDRRWQVMVVEDADRLGERTGNTLLKAIEEPTPKTVWLLCAPTVEDVLPTIRSRCRNVALTTPTAQEVARFLQDADGTPDALAAFAARASQGHIGRARALARDERTRNRRREVVSLPARLSTLVDCLNAASNLLAIAKDETAAITETSNTRELGDLDTTYGDDRKSHASRAYRAALRELTHHQTQREKRRVMDVIDRSLMDLMSVYRDAIAVQTGARGALINEEMRADIVQIARRSTPEGNLRRIDAIFAARDQMMEFNANREMTLEAMMVALRLTDPAR